MTGAGRPGRRRSGGTGRRAGLKIPCPRGREGSSPSSGTKAIRRAGNKPLSALFYCLGAQEGVERARGADEQEEKRDARACPPKPWRRRERVSPEPRRKSRWPGWPRLRRATPPPALTHRMRTGEERRAISEDERDARERGRSEPRRKGRSPGWAAPLPDEMRSLGYPATNIPWGKAQAGESLLRHLMHRT